MLTSSVIAAKYLVLLSYNLRRKKWLIERVFLQYL